MPREAQMEIERALRTVVGLLVRGEYARLARLAGGVRLSAAEIEAAVHEYGRVLVDPPDDAFSNADVIRIVGMAPSAYSVWFRLHARGEAPSELVLQTTLIGDPERGAFTVEIDNILVP